MAKKRVIDTEGLYYDEDIVRLLGAKGLHLYIRLWSLADDFGGYDPNYFEISQKMGALKIRPWQVKRLIRKLVKTGKIIPYYAEGKEYHWIKRFQKHQRLHKPNLPKIPVPEWIDFKTGKYDSGRKYAIYKDNINKIPSNIKGLSSDSPRTVPVRTETKDNIYIHSTKSIQRGSRDKNSGEYEIPKNTKKEIEALTSGINKLT